MEAITFGILTVSDSCFKGTSEDRSGPNLKNVLENLQGFSGKVCVQSIVPDEVKEIKEKLLEWVYKEKCDVILTTGGTGFSPRDVTPEATKMVIERESPGLTYAMMKGSFNVTQMAMLSRSASGIIGKTIIINLPGSKKASQECLEFVAPGLAHAVDLLQDRRSKIAATHVKVQSGTDKQPDTTAPPPKVMRMATEMISLIKPRKSARVQKENDVSPQFTEITNAQSLLSPVVQSEEICDVGANTSSVDSQSLLKSTNQCKSDHNIACKISCLKVPFVKSYPVTINVVDPSVIGDSITKKCEELNVSYHDQSAQRNHENTKPEQKMSKAQSVLFHNDNNIDQVGTNYKLLTEISTYDNNAPRNVILDKSSRCDPLPQNNPISSDSQQDFRVSLELQQPNQDYRQNENKSSCSPVVNPNVVTNRYHNAPSLSAGYINHGKSVQIKLHPMQTVDFSEATSTNVSSSSYIQSDTGRFENFVSNPEEVQLSICSVEMPQTNVSLPLNEQFQVTSEQTVLPDKNMEYQNKSENEDQYNTAQNLPSNSAGNVKETYTHKHELNESLKPPQMHRTKHSEVFYIPVGDGLKSFLEQHHSIQGLHLNRGKRTQKRDLVKVRRQEMAVDVGSWKRGSKIHERNRLDDTFILTPAGEEKLLKVMAGKEKDEFVVNWYLFCPGHGNCLRKCGEYGRCIEGCPGVQHKQDRHNCTFMVNLRILLSAVETWRISTSGSHVPPTVVWQPPDKTHQPWEEAVKDKVIKCTQEGMDSRKIAALVAVDIGMDFKVCHRKVIHFLSSMKKRRSLKSYDSRSNNRGEEAKTVSSTEFMVADPGKHVSEPPLSL